MRTETIITLHLDGFDVEVLMSDHTGKEDNAIEILRAPESGYIIIMPTVFVESLNGHGMTHVLASITQACYHIESEST